MMPGFKRTSRLLGLLPMALFAASVAAHPLIGDDGADSAGLGPSAFVELPALANPQALAAEPLRSSPALADALGSAGATGPQFGVAGTPPAPSFVETVPMVSGAAADFAQPDPLARALRSVVNVQRRGGGTSSRRPALPAEQISPLWGDEFSAVVGKMEEGLAGIVSEALDARVDDEGRVTFSLLGIDGLHITASDSEVSFGRGDAAVAFSRSGGDRLQQRVATIDAVRAAEQRLEPSDANPVRELLEFAARAIQYPLFWVLVVLAVIGKLALVIAKAHAVRRSHRRKSASVGGADSAGSSATQTAKVKRARMKVRLKRLRTRIRLRQAT